MKNVLRGNKLVIWVDDLWLKHSVCGGQCVITVNICDKNINDHTSMLIKLIMYLRFTSSPGKIA